VLPSVEQTCSVSSDMLGMGLLVASYGALASGVVSYEYARWRDERRSARGDGQLQQQQEALKKEAGAASQQAALAEEDIQDRNAAETAPAEEE